jgi:hypothetical protein
MMVALLLPGAAHAFADATQFFDQQLNPHAATLGASGEGVYFTGAPRFSSLTCQACHVGAPGLVGLRLGADHPELFSDGYLPGAIYELEVELTNETKGLVYNRAGGTCTDPLGPGDTFTYIQCNNNGYALEIDAQSGPLKGSFCAQPPNGGSCPKPDNTVDESLLAPDGDAIFSDRVYSADPKMPKAVLHNGAYKWHLYWTAPPAGTGPLTIYVAAVDGNGGSGTSDNDQDPYNDDVVQASFFVQEAGAPTSNTASAGCVVGGRAPATDWFYLGLVALVGASRVRRARSRVARKRVRDRGR